MQCNGYKIMNKENKYKKIGETLQLVDDGDPEMNLGVTYLAKSNEDVFIGLDKLEITDCLNTFLLTKNEFENDGIITELTINCVDEDGYICTVEAEDTDEDGLEADKTDVLSKEDTIEFLNSLFTEYTVINIIKAKQTESMSIKELSEALDKILSEDVTTATTIERVDLDKFGKTWEIDKEYKAADCQLYNRPDYEKAGLITIYAPKENVKGRGKWKTVVDFYLNTDTDKKENEPAHFELITDDCPTNRMIQYTVEKEAKEKYKKVVKLNIPRTDGIRKNVLDIL